MKKKKKKNWSDIKRDDVDRGCGYALRRTAEQFRSNRLHYEDVFAQSAVEQEWVPGSKPLQDGLRKNWLELVGVFQSVEVIFLGLAKLYDAEGRKKKTKTKKAGG